ncbi:MAG: SUMF1/EgtB/PvdO family nonheme iron enzyme [Anaerolineales bacterium]|nr:SUMF1/EgtB/PvdO family nonheme iron enzyme [Anaerolineales bacterium]
MSDQDGAEFIQAWVRRGPAESEAHLGSIGLLHRVPGGPFVMGSRFHPREAPRREVTVPEFEIAHAPVTVQQFAAFIEAGGYTEQPWWDEAGWAWRQGRGLTWGRPERARPADWPTQSARFDHPVAGLTVYEAEAYCRWLGAQKGRVVRLPTEEEWEKAARGADGRPWPWGAEFRPEHANTLERDLNHTTPTASLAGDVSACGAVDMGGNVQEWTASAYTPLPDERFVAGQAVRVARGGSYNDSAYGARAAYRRGYPPGYYFPFLGFRIVVAAK